MPLAPIGLLIIPLGIYIAVAHPRKLLPLMVFCSVFQASSVSGQFGLSPYVYIGIIVLIRYILESAYSLRFVATQIHPAFWFWLWSVASAAFLPVIFAGMPVLDPRLALEQIEFGPTPLHPSASNAFQVVLLTINLVAVMEARRTKVDCWPAFKWAAVVAIAIIYLQVLAGDKFPYFLINNNPAYGQAHMDTSLGLLRPSGTFVEPSTAGAYFCGLACFCLVNYFEARMSLWKCLLAIATLVVVGSTSGFAAFGVLVIIIAIRYRPFQSLNIRVGLIKKWAIVAICAVVPFLLAAPLASHLVENTAGKQGSYSILIRAGADWFAFQVFVRTYGIGVGLGSIRASSFVVTFLASLGIIGVVLFVWFLTKLRPNWITFGILAAMAVGVPDLSLSVFWASLALSPELTRDQA